MLLDLPAELRNQIYSHLLTVPPPGTPRPLGQRPRVHVSILAVCRQTHAEAMPILYGGNTFVAHYSLLTEMPALCRMHPPVLSGRLIKHIRRYHVYIRLDCDAHFTAQKVAESFSGLEELTIEMYQAQYGSSDYTVLKLFENVRGVKKVNIIGSTRGFPDYAAWLLQAMMSAVDGMVAPYSPSTPESEKDLWTVSTNPGNMYVSRGRVEISY